MRKFQVTGMSCAACSARVEKAVNSLDGVKECAVNLLTNSMSVEGDISTELIMEAVEKAGYKAFPADSENRAGTEAAKKNSGEKTELTDKADKLNNSQKKEVGTLVRRLVFSLILLIPLMYVSMGHTMWKWPLPFQMAENHVGVGLIQLALTTVILAVNRKFFDSGVKGLLHLAPNMDTLVALGAGASYVYSFYVLYAMSAAQSAGNSMKVMEYMHDFYFESAAMIVTLITVGKLLEAVSKGKTTSALRGLMDLAPKMAVVLRDGIETEIPAAQVVIGDRFVLKPGSAVPVDGTVIEGDSTIDESALTGESIPSDKKPGDPVWAATMNQYGSLVCEATKVGSDTVLSQIIRMVEDASATKAPIAKLADKVSGVFVPVVMAVAFLTAVIWLVAGADFSFALSMGISVLVISCPCALGLATPVAIMVGSGVGAKKGILFKTAASLEQAGKTNIVVLDKTGTITEGMPHVTYAETADKVEEKELASVVLSLESKSEHPIGEACVQWAGSVSGSRYMPLENFQALAGKGLQAMTDGLKIWGGSLSYMSREVRLSENVLARAKAIQAKGETPVVFACGDEYIGMVAVADVIKQDSPSAIGRLRQMGLKVVMLTGDNERTAKTIASAAGVDEVVAEVLPGEKEENVRRLQKSGQVMMVGDGINDAPALTRADTGVAIGAGADIALDAADVVISASRLTDVVNTIRLSRQTLRNIKENLFWAFIYNVIGIPLAAGVWYPMFGWKLNPMFGAAAMSLSSVCVVTNALRLNLFKFEREYRSKKMRNPEPVKKKSADKEEKKEKEVKEKTEMKRIFEIEGMMCGHCEATVKKTLESFEEVREAVVSHEKNEAVVAFCEGAEPTQELIGRMKKAIEDKEYTVTAVTQ